MSKFKASYEIDDGYAGGSRPQYFHIHEGDLDDEMTDDELRAFFEETMEECFRENIGCSPRNIDQFVEWAREQLANRKSA